MVVPASCWSCGVMEVEAAGVCGLPPACVESLRGGAASLRSPATECALGETRGPNSRLQ